MANKPAKQPAPPEIVARSAAPLITEIDLEDAIADQLLDDIDWSKVKAAMLTKVKQRFFAWLTNSDNTPVNISQFPELSVLPSAQDGEAA